MNHCCLENPFCGRRGPRRGLTLIELLVAMAVIGMVIGTLSTLANAVQQNYEFSHGRDTATQHARVVLDRIAKTIDEATANEQFPGFIVVAETEGAWRFPETLVVWHPSSTPVDPNGLPRFNELVIYCPNAYIPSNLIEITVPGDTRTVPAVTNSAQWLTEIQAIRKSAAVKTVTLTTLLRTCSVTTSSPKWRGAVRFESRLRPTADEWTNYKAGSLAWKDLNWVQGIYGSQTGLRQTWLRMELQLLPVADASDPAAATATAIPFFGSAAIYYEMHK